MLTDILISVIVGVLVALFASFVPQLFAWSALIGFVVGLVVFLARRGNLE